MTNARPLLTLAALLTAASCLLLGCDDASTGSALSISPPSTTIEGKGSVVLTAIATDSDTPTNRNQEIILPLSWEVGNPNLGSVSGNAGFTAVYVSNGRIGQNTIFARDAIGREGVAVVSQVEPPPVATATTP
jgi:hypothetical protein